MSIKRCHLLLLLSTLLTLNACTLMHTNNVVKSQKPAKSGPEIKWQTGVIKHLALEGGFYGIVTESGQKLLPINLNDSFKVDGMKVNFSGYFNKDVITINQWGYAYQLVEISRVD